MQSVVVPGLVFVLEQGSELVDPTLLCDDDVAQVHVIDSRRNMGCVLQWLDRRGHRERKLINGLRKLISLLPPAEDEVRSSTTIGWYCDACRVVSFRSLQATRQGNVSWRMRPMGFSVG